jgi:hypothetical protein
MGEKQMSAIERAAEKGGIWKKKVRETETAGKACQGKKQDGFPGIPS